MALRIGRKKGKSVRVALLWSGAELREMGYPILVERWDYVLKTGKGMREYRRLFDEPERKTISRYHTIFREWYLNGGTPGEHEMTLRTYNLLVRAIKFFAEF
jgi:hypothetical protein